jgi:hypothetical protein
VAGSLRHESFEFAVIACDHEVLFAISIEVGEGEALGIPRDNQPTAMRPHWGKMSGAIAFEQKADSPVVMARLPLRTVRVANEIEIGVTVAREITRHHSMHGKTLGQPWERSEAKPRFSLVEEDARLKGVGLETLRLVQARLRVNGLKRFAREGMKGRELVTENGHGMAGTTVAAPWQTDPILKFGLQDTRLSGAIKVTEVEKLGFLLGGFVL